MQTDLIGIMVHDVCPLSFQGVVESAFNTLKTIRENNVKQHVQYTSMSTQTKKKMQTLYEKKKEQGKAHLKPLATW